MNSEALLRLALTFALIWSGNAAAASREIPRPLKEHPGNIFVAGEEVVVPLPAAGTNEWRLVDYEGRILRQVSATAGQASLGRLSVGFYRLRPPVESRSNWISLAVLAPLKAPTPLTSPVALDVAMSWFYPEEKMDAAANLCALAGVNWVRDRLNWREVEPHRGEVRPPPTRYDASAKAQSRAGLQVLQVNHVSPGWATANPKRFPDDLRDAYNFYREMARRWRGQVLAFEPWNEADIPMFGGHTGAEMASLQKAAFLGLKAGNPDAIVGQNVFALHNGAQLEDLRDNGAAPYFDTFNLHHYEAFDAYPRLYAAFRAVSAGKPLWVTEAARPVKWSDEPSKELSDAELKEQAERVVKSFALSLHEGTAAMFYFLLPHYVEGQTQFGVLRPDLTPRPGFVALAAVGRLLADAKPLGKVPSTNQAVHAIWFEARPDGQRADVLVAWSEASSAILPVPAGLRRMFNHVGVGADAAGLAAIQGEVVASFHLGPAPVFGVFPPGTARKLRLEPTPRSPARDTSSASSVVLQSLWPEEKTALKQSAYRIPSDRRETIPVWLYNFDRTPAHGVLKVSAPANWKVELPDAVDLAPEERRQLALNVDARSGAGQVVETLRIEGDFGPAGHAILSLRLMPEPFRIPPDLTAPLTDASQSGRWRTMISEDGSCRISGADDRQVLVEAAPKGSDRWVYPVLRLESDEVPSADATGLIFSFTLHEGDGEFRVIFDEQNGSSYVAGFSTPLKAGKTVEAAVWFTEATPGTGWSKADANARLDPDQIVSLKVGANTKGAALKYSFGNLRWIKR